MFIFIMNIFIINTKLHYIRWFAFLYICRSNSNCQNLQDCYIPEFCLLYLKLNLYAIITYDFCEFILLLLLLVKKNIRDAQSKKEP